MEAAAKMAGCDSPIPAPLLGAPHALYGGRWVAEEHILFANGTEQQLADLAVPGLQAWVAECPLGLQQLDKCGRTPFVHEVLPTGVLRVSFVAPSGNVSYRAMAAGTWREVSGGKSGPAFN